MENRNYYGDIPDDQFVPLDCLEKEFNGVYEINKLGHIKTISSGYIRKKFSLNSNGYPYITLTSSKNISKKKVVRIHILIAKMFIPNPENKPVIDHKNRDRSDFSISNLRWCSYSENGKNKDNLRLGKNSDRYVYARCDDEMIEIERIPMKNLSTEELRKINESRYQGKKYLSYNWIKIDLELEDYIKRFGIPEEKKWKTCLRIPKLECNPIGLIRIKETKKILFGSKKPEYRRISFKYKQYSTHRLVYETFSGRLLKENDVIDHINTIKDDNRFCNLLFGSQKDNMSNPLTIIKKSKPILKYTLEGIFVKEYPSVKDAYLDVAGKTNGFSFKNRLTYFGHLWCYKGEEYKIEEMMKKIIFKYDKDYNLVKAYSTVGTAARLNHLTNHMVNTRIETGLLAKDGFYYSRGPRNFDNENE